VALGELASRGEAGRGPQRIADYVRATEGAAPDAVWRPWAVGIYRAWLQHIWARKAGRTAAPDAGLLASQARAL